MGRRIIRFCALTVGMLLCTAWAVAAGGVEVLNGDTLWRTYITFTPTAWDKANRYVMHPGYTQPLVQWGYGIPSPAPPSTWTAPDFDDSGWVRRAGAFLGDYGEVRDGFALVCMRARFRLDAAPVSPMTLNLTYRGGVVVYLNGKEIARGHMPAGKLAPLADAQPYPRDAFVTPDGQALLASLSGTPPPAALRDRYAARFRTTAVTLPAAELRRGVNVLALALHRAQTPDDLPTTGGRLWATVGLVDATLQAEPASKAEPNTGPPTGVQVWTADPMEWVGRDVTYGDPADAIPPVELQAPRNGVSSAQAVVSGPAALPALAARAGELRSPDGAVIPAAAIRVRYADAGKIYVPLLDAPVPGASVQPIWVTVTVPADARPGRYTGTLTIDGLAVPVDVPIVLTVYGWHLPDPQRWRTFVSLLQSPESVAGYYKVPLWSDEHFRLLEPSLRLLGECGNDVLGINAIGKTVFGNDPLVVLKKQGDTYVPDFTFLERYLTLYNRCAGEPRFLAIQVWHYNGNSRFCAAEDGGGMLMAWENGVMTPVTPTPELWGEVLRGIRQRAEQLGWRNVRYLLGTSGDQWPAKETVEMFRRAAPFAQWRVLTHGAGCPKWGATDAERTQPNGMVVGYLEIARRTGSVRERYPYAPVSSSARDDVSAQPYRYRELPTLHSGRCNYDGFCWKGLDYWTYTLPDGRQRSALNTDIYFGNMVGGVPRAISAPGPHGAVATMQYELLRQGCQECEAMLFVKEALQDPACRKRLGEATAARAEQEIEDLLDTVETGGRLAGGGDYRAVAERCYTLAGEVAAALE